MLPVYRAFDREQFAEIPTHSDADLEQKLQRAHQARANRKRWLPPHERIAVLQRLAALVESEKERFVQLITLEGGKPFTDATVEVTRAVDGIRDAAEELRQFGGREIPMGLTRASEGRLAFTIREPIGVVAAISAFNHPLNLIVHQVVPAIATGCPVIIKPSAVTPMSCQLFIKLVWDAGLAQEFCDIFVPQSDAGAEKLATDSRIALLSFVGSARVGWLLRSKVAAGTRCVLEHGGAAPCFIHDDADIASLLEPIVKGSYYHAGQVCVSTQRIFVHERKVDDFSEQFIARVGKLRVGDPSASDTEVGPLILPREVDRVEAWVAEATGAGAKLALGGRLSATSYRPGVLIEPPASARVSREEVFGPITCIYRYSDIEEAIATANALPYAFQASVFTNNLDLALHVGRHVDASAVMINDHTAFRTDWMPFAGRKQSGLGVGGIPWTMQEMTEQKMLVFKH